MTAIEGYFLCLVPRRFDGLFCVFSAVMSVLVWRHRVIPRRSRCAVQNALPQAEHATGSVSSGMIYASQSGRFSGFVSTLRPHGIAMIVAV